MHAVALHVLPGVKLQFAMSPTLMLPPETCAPISFAMAFTVLFFIGISSLFQSKCDVLRLPSRGGRLFSETSQKPLKKGKEKESHSLMAAFPVVAGIPCFTAPDRSGYPGQFWRLPCLQISSPGALLRHCFRPILGSPCSVCFSRYLRECLSRQRGA